MSLTNTTWAWKFGKQTPSFTGASSTVKNINFTSNGSTFTSMTFNSGTSTSVSYGSTTVWSYDSSLQSEYYNPNYRLFTITGGTDVDDSDLIAWLQANAMQITLFNLSGTTWVFNNAVEHPGSTTSYAINFTSSNESYIELVLSVGINYQYEMDYAIDLEQSYDIAVYSSTAGVVTMTHWQHDSYKTIVISGGTDATNMNLILWLFDNATLQAGTMKLVDATQLDSDLTSIADAIRAKSGGTSPLVFPSGFVSEIGNIPTGGGEVDPITINKISSIKLNTLLPTISIEIQ